MQRFFECLFMGGTVADALSLLRLSSSRGGGAHGSQCMHVRSPIYQKWNEGTASFDLRRRDVDPYAEACLLAHRDRPPILIANMTDSHVYAQRLLLLAGALSDLEPLSPGHRHGAS